MSLSTEELYGSQLFDELVAIGCIEVYEMHIVMLEKQLANTTDRGDYNTSFKIKKSQELFRTLIKQAKDNCARKQDTKANRKVVNFNWM